MARADVQRRIYGLNDDSLHEIEAWLGKVREIWHTHLHVRADVLDGSKPRPFYRMRLRYESEYTKRPGLT